MATSSRTFSDAFYTYVGSSVTLSGAGSSSKDWDEEIDITETVVLESATVSDFEVVEEIELEDDFSIEKLETIGDEVHPNVGNYALFILQEEEYSGVPGEIGEKVWVDKHTFTFTIEDQPKDNWKFKEIARLAPELMESKEFRIYDSCIHPRWSFVFEQWYNETDASKFFLRFAGSWLQNKGDTFDRRILFYPYGDDVYNEYGDLVEPFVVFFPEHPAELYSRHGAIDGRENVYKVLLKVWATEALDHDEYREKIVWFDSRTMR